MFICLDVFKSFVEAVGLHGVEKHLAIQLLIQVGGILTDAACDEDLEGKEPGDQWFFSLRKYNGIERGTPGLAFRMSEFHESYF